MDRLEYFYDLRKDKLYNIKYKMKLVNVSIKVFYAFS